MSGNASHTFPPQTAIHKRSFHAAFEADVDGDSTMRSSPSNSDPEDNPNPFPSTRDLATPTPDLDHGAPVSELSPPTSQDPPDTNNNVAMTDPTEEQQQQQPSSVGGGEERRTMNGIRGLKAKEEEAEVPGATWKTKRAQEEFQRAMETVVDKDFNLRKCVPLCAARFKTQD